MNMKLAKGDRVCVRRDPTDEWCEGDVVLVSPNGESVGLMLHGSVRAGDGFILNALPLIVDYSKETITGLTGDLYELEINHD
jgi:hypothetical protein